MVNPEVVVTLERLLEAVADEGIREPDVIGVSYLKWDRSDGGYVIFRANVSGPWGTLDCRWLEDDGVFNGPFCPVSYDWFPWITRDISVLLEDGVTKAVVPRLAKT